VVPSFNFNLELSRRSIDAMHAWAAQNGARVWITHDREQHARIAKAPAFVE
jgi:ABC-type iron transport system FetAB ATPase subunit